MGHVPWAVAEARDVPVAGPATLQGPGPLLRLGAVAKKPKLLNLAEVKVVGRGPWARNIIID